MASPMTQRLQEQAQPDPARRPSRCAWHLKSEDPMFTVRHCKRFAKVRVMVNGEADYHGDGFCRQHGRMAEDHTVARVMNSARVTLEEVR
jgi:hypothetical protein